MTTRCETCGDDIPVSAPARVTCRGDVRPGQPMHPDIGHDIYYVKEEGQ